MSKTEPYSPTSIHNLVDKRIDRQAQGCTPNFRPRNSGMKFQNPDQKPLQTKQTKDLQTDFLELLLSKHDHPGLMDDQIPKDSLESCEFEGTNDHLNSLNKQEQTKNQSLENSKAPFQLKIENTSIGPISIQGHYKNDLLVLKITTNKSFSVQEKMILKSFLKSKLSSNLERPLEVLID